MIAEKSLANQIEDLFVVKGFCARA